MDAKLTRQAEELALEVASQATTLEELNGVMRSLMKSALEKMLSTELDVHLGRVPEVLAETIAEAGEAASGGGGKEASPPRNRKNGFSPKTIQGDMGKLPLDIPRDLRAATDRQAPAASGGL